MILERQKIEIDEENELITGMIVNDKFLRHITPLYHGQLLKNSFSQIVAKWCLEYFKKYEKAPGQLIQSIFTSEQTKLNTDVSESIQIFLENLSDKFENLESYNVDYHIDKAEKYLKKQSLRKLSETIQGHVEMDRVVEAELSVSKYKRVSRANGEGLDVLSDHDRIIDAFSTEEEEMFSFPGALGEATGGFYRDDLIAIAGPAKSGKTWWLIWIAILALTSGKNVGYFCLEMTERQMIRRIYQTLLGESKKPFSDGLKIPRFDEYGNIQEKTIITKGVNAHSAIKKARALRRITRGAKFKMICSPRFGLSSAEIEAHLDNWETYDKFLPDVLLIDYGDIVAPLDKRNEHRHQINEVWQWMAATAQKRHCLVVSPTHTGRATYSRDAAEGDVVEDIRKLNHVAGVISLNRKKDDREKNIVRVSTWAARHEGNSPEVEVLECLAIGKPCLDSKVVKK